MIRFLTKFVENNFNQQESLLLCNLKETNKIYRYKNYDIISANKFKNMSVRIDFNLIQEKYKVDLSILEKTGFILFL